MTRSRYIQGGVGVAVDGYGSIRNLRAVDELARTGRVVPLTWAR
ncbi:MAG: hypothetical protein V3S32_04710 [Acidimicrobiia bacterium]